MNARWVACAALGALTFGFPAAGQVAAKPAGAKSSKAYTPPKLPWGDPDLQGQWPAASSIPMQRPANLANRAELTDRNSRGPSA